jgi:CHAT domain-containing protein
MTSRYNRRAVALLLCLFLSRPGIAQYPDQRVTRSIEIALSKGEQAALDYLRSELDRAIQEGDRAGEAWAKYGLGRGAAVSGRYEEAARYFESAIGLAESMGDRIFQGMGLAYLAFAQARAGQVEESYEKYVRAVQAFESSGDENRALPQLRDFAKHERHLRQREYLFERALDMARRNQWPDQQAGILKEWSDALITAGDSTRAMEKLQQGIAAAGLAPNYNDYAGLFVSQGRLHRLHGNHAQAIDSYERALELRRKSVDRLGQSMVLQYMGLSYVESGQRRKGLEFMEEAAAIARANADTRERLVNTFSVLGAGYVELGEYRRAIDLLEEVHRDPGINPPFPTFWALSAAYFHAGRYVPAVEIATRGLGLAKQTGNPEPMIFLLSWRAEALRKIGRIEEAVADVRAALELIEQIRARLVPADFMKRGFTTQYLRVVNLAVEVFFETGRHTEAFEVAEQSRARSFLDLLATRNATAHEVWIDLDAEPLGSEGPADVEPVLASTITALPATRANVQALASRMGSTVLAYWVNPDALYMWSVHADGSIHGARQKMSENRLNELVRRAESRNRRDREAWQELYRYLIQPLRPHLPKTGSRVTVIPHGSLFKLPFAALTDARGRYFVEDYALHYVPALATLDLIEEHKNLESNVSGGPVRYLVAADPSRPPRLSDGTALAPLAGSRLEMQRVIAQLPRGAADVLTGISLRSEAVHRALGDHDVLHFATHAVIDAQRPLDSFLALSRGERLTAREIYDASINAELVMLSACRSASGPISAEGVFGLTRAFFYAGAASVIASPWDVADEPTAVLVEEFYRQHRRSADKDRALRAAQLRLIQDLRNGRVHATTPAGTMALPEHPALWAGLILIGNPN